MTKAKPPSEKAPAPVPSEREIVAWPRKSENGEIVVSLMTLDGIERVDVRTFAAFGHAPAPTPTRSGFSLPVAQLDALIDGLIDARDAARHRRAVPAKPAKATRRAPWDGN